DCFGVTACAISTATRLQIRPQLDVIVDFAVVDQADARLLIDHRLMASAHVDDRQAAVAEPDGAPRPQTRPVWPPMAPEIAHSRQPRLIDRPAVKRNDSDDATHASPSDRRHSRPRLELTANRRREKFARQRVSQEAQPPDRDGFEAAYLEVAPRHQCAK